MPTKKNLKSLNLRALLLSGGFLDPETSDIFMSNRLGGAYMIRDCLQKYNVETEVVDMLESWPEDIADKYLDHYSKRHWVNIICISGTFMTNEYVSKISAKAKKYFPRAVILLGSGNPSLKSNHFVNYHVYSYGEKAVIACLENYFLGTPLECETRGRTKFVNALHNYVAWPKEDYSLKYQDTDFVDQNTVGTFEMSRGCRFKCSFCNWPILGIKEDTSQKDIQYQVDALEHNYQKYGMTEYFIADDTYNDRTSKLEKLAEIVSRLSFEPNFTAFMRLDLLWSLREQWDLLKPARLLSHHYGLETFNKETAKIIGKGKQAEIAKDTLLEIQNYLGEDYTGYATLIVGLPKESKESIQATHDWLNENWSRGYWHWYNLDIHQDAEVLSAFGTDMAKYNYTVDKGKVPLGLSKKVNEGTVFWKNEYFDANSSYEFAQQLNSGRKKRVPNAWMMRQGTISPREVLEKYIRKKFDLLYKIW